MQLQTLQEATRRYRLRDASISNADIEDRLGVVFGRGDAIGEPSCCFYNAGFLAGIRTTPQEVVIFHIFQHSQNMMGSIADRVTDQAPREGQLVT